VKITVATKIEFSLDAIWNMYTTPEDILQWNAASDDWHTVSATVDLREGGEFCSRMEAKDGSFGFDFRGTYTEVIPKKRIAYTFGDRTANVEFIEDGNEVEVRIAFDAEEENPVEKQRDGWQSILENFKKHVLSEDKAYRRVE
jgi:uncharacterized protein YndB with AHSA1/START domain